VTPALALLALVLGGPAPGTGATISGTVRAAPVPPVPAVEKIAKDQTVCGREAAAERLVVGADGGLANVVVAVALKGWKPPQAPAPTAGAAVDQVGCRYTPHVQAVTVGTTLAVLNNDAVLHNVHATTGAPGAAPVTVFNVAMPWKGQKLPMVLRRPGTLKLRCDAGHTWMSAYIHVFDHPYFAVTDARGQFAIDATGLPPGRYTLEYWHEPLGNDDRAPALVKTATVEVGGDRGAVADAVLSWPR
jgi:plastocyanin